MNPRAPAAPARVALTVLKVALAASLALPAAAEFGEIGPNDFRVSFGPASTLDVLPAVAYSPLHDVYLVVWQRGLSGSGGQVEARLLSGASGQPIGVVIEPLPGQPCLVGECFFDPAVAYSVAADRFVVVAAAHALFPGQVSNELEVVAFDVDPATGASSWGFLMSDAGGLGNATYGAFSPAVACSSTTEECLVVWSGDDNVSGLVDNEYEIFGQRFDATTGAAVGANDFRISDAGGTGIATFSARAPALAYNGGDNEYLVVWQGDDNVGGLVANEFEIFGQRLNAATGTAQGVNDFRISDMGGTGAGAYDALTPAVAYANSIGQYLVVWSGADDVGGLQLNELEIFGQRLVASTGAETGANDFRVSDMGGTGGANYGALSPSVAFAAALGEYLVTWLGDDDVGGLQNNEYEIFAQRLVASIGAETGANDFRVSDMGGTGENPFGAFLPKVAYNSNRAEVLVVWYGDDDGDGLGDEVWEVFGQRLGEQELFADGFETGDTSAWSLTEPGAPLP